MELLDVHDVEALVLTDVSGRGSEQLLFAVDQVSRVHRRQLEAMAVGNGVGRTSLDTVAAENAAVVVDVVDLGVTFRAGDAILFGVLGGLDVNAVGRASGGAEEAGYALFEAVLIALKDMETTEALLKNGALERSGTIWIVLNNGGLEHLAKSDAHAFGDSGDVIDDSHMRNTTDQYNKWVSSQ